MNKFGTIITPKTLAFDAVKRKREKRNASILEALDEYLVEEALKRFEQITGIKVTDTDAFIVERKVE